MWTIVLNRERSAATASLFTGRNPSCRGNNSFAVLQKLSGIDEKNRKKKDKEKPCKIILKIEVTRVFTQNSPPTPLLQYPDKASNSN